MSAGVTVIIPARLGSTRLARKVLLNETGRPLLQHVWEAALRSERAERVVIATDTDEVGQAASAFGAEVVMTSERHPNGTSRLAEAADVLGLSDDSVVVNVQGDEPELDPGVVDAAISALEHSGDPMSTVGSPFGEGESPESPSIVKVVTRCDGRALLFSRGAIPHVTDPQQAGARPLKHVGLYCYRRWFLRTYVGLSPTPLEIAERLEQLRALEHGYDIRVAVCHAKGRGIDTPDDYAEFVKRWRESGAG